MGDGHDLGRWGERVAEGYLCSRGWRILSRNFRDGPRELDLVVRRGDLTAFVEVKTRTSSMDDALQSVTRRKRLDLTRAACRWIQDHPGSHGPFRFDLIVVRDRPGAQAQIEHLEDAWWKGD